MQKASVAFENVAEEPDRSRHGIALSEIENVLVGRGVAIWQQIRGLRPYPTRAEMSPRVMSGMLRNTVLVRVLCGGDEYEMRIVGDAIVQAQGASLQGMTMAEIDLVLPGYGSLLRAVYKSAYRKRSAAAYRGWFVREADDRSMFHETVVLPLGEAGQPPDHLQILAVYAMQPGEKPR
jgi:hypothetical protein